MSRHGNWPLQVEFVGLPAVGKTYFADAVASQLSEAFPDEVVTTSSGKRSQRARSTVMRFLAARLLGNPRQSLQSLRAIHASGQRGVDRVLRYWLFHMYVLEELRRARLEDEVHLADQGFIQHLWRVHLTAERSTRSDLREWVGRLSPEMSPDLVVFVEVDHQTRMERGVERGTPVDPSLFDPDHPEIQRDIEAYGDIVNAIEALESPCIRIENTESSFDENLATVVERIIDHIAPEPTR